MQIEEEEDYESDLPEAEEEPESGGGLEDLNPLARLAFIVIGVIAIAGFVTMVIAVAGQIGE